MDIFTLLSSGTAILGLAVGATFLLPRTVEVTRSAHVAASPEVLLRLAASTEGFQSFNPYLTADPALKITPFGPAEGLGAGFAFEGKDGKGTQTVSAITPESVTYVIDLGPLGQPVQTIRALPEGAGSRVTWQVESDLGRNPLFRLFGLFMERMMGPTFETGLDNLARATS